MRPCVLEYRAEIMSKRKGRAYAAAVYTAFHIEPDYDNKEIPTITHRT